MPTVKSCEYLPVNDARCRECSLIEICQPAALAGQNVQRELRAELFSATDEG